MKAKLLFIVFIELCSLNTILAQANTNNQSFHGLQFTKLPVIWDEGIPLGNGIMGSLIWEKDGKLRLALDRADLWDLRPVKEFESPSYSYQFVCDEIIQRKDVSKVRALIDDRSRKDCAPTKIPVGAIEIPISQLGIVKSVELDVHTAVCTIVWECGTVGKFFTGAMDKTGHFRFENLPAMLSIELQTPRFEEDGTSIQKVSAPRTHPLTRLGYKNGKIAHHKNSIVYRQKAYGKVAYEVAVEWNTPTPNALEGSYCITTQGTWYSESIQAADFIKNHAKDFNTSLAEHIDWWKTYWVKSAIHLPDSILENQWYLEMYKFGAASRKNAPPICLQAVWTADNGQTPPWRGDFHNDLNTQLSYWPGYSSNHLEESSVFTDWLWKIKSNGEEFTRRFFGVEGLNIPCIATLEGRAIGGWSPYSHQPTTSGWLAQHFYLQWKYNADDDFLKNQAYPWVKEVARYFSNVSVKDAKGMRKLPLSSSPEINDNELDAWFQKTTNYDLANIRLTYTAAAEMADTLGLIEDADLWRKQLEEWPDFAKDSTGLTIAPDYPLTVSHRHLSHMLAFHPFGLLDVSQGNEAERLIKRSIHHMEELGNELWIGYTYTWLANMKARIFDGDAVARNLHIFIKAFCSPNSFHLNGDQLQKGYTNFTYRPFTLEGNFAYASAVQEMLLQSHTGIIRIFPAIPESWNEASFRDLRAMGAFLVSADYKNGKVDKVTVRSEKGGKLRILNPFTNKVEERNTKSGELIEWK
ncbi:glycoside hydrolase family 95-like protein [Bacteroides sp.]|uniref:glycosyl hydrolase family 95 catalytic domain-containing protein n=1 Tax=Bacteroides sp. TaxID=29523 RepID=UPI00262EBFD0|nr:hypothetical protein [Bacteroides sp.]